MRCVKYIFPLWSQVLLDTSDHTDFSDYLRVTRFNTTDPFAIKPVGIIEKIPLVSSSEFCIYL